MKPDRTPEPKPSRQRTEPSVWRRRNLLAVMTLLSSLWSIGVALAGDLDEVRARGSLRVVTMPQQNAFFARVDVDMLRDNNAPLSEIHDARYFSGTDIEIMKEFAAFLGVDLTVVAVTTSWSDLIPTLLEGRGDLVAASLTITPERGDIVEFSDPYMVSYIVATLPRSKKDSIRTPSDLSGRTAAVMRGSSQLELVRPMNLGLDFLLTDYALEGQAAVEEGRADILFLDSAAPIGQVPEPAYPDFVIALRLANFKNAFALRPDSDLVEPLNRFLSELRASGKLDRIFDAEGVLGIVTTPTAEQTP